MLSKRKLAVILPMLFELAMSYEQYHTLDTIPLKHRATNHWGKEGPAKDEKIVKVGSIGGGYYGRTVPGLRDYEKGNAKDRAFGSKVESYPYKFEPERTLNNDSLIPLSPEARLRMMREPFREYIYNMTGQVPTLEEVKKMRPQFKEYVKKELNLTNSEVESLFGIQTTKKSEGKLPKYLLFDDMDEFDFDPEEALKYMPRISKKATKEEIDNAYIKAWEILGKSDDKLKKVYQAYRRKYLQKNPLGPVMTEKEFLLHSIRLREREAARLGFISAEPNSDPISKSIEISYFLRDALKDEYEKYKSQNSNDRFSSAKNFVYDALFTDDLIIDEIDRKESSLSPETLPSPYDPIEGRAWTNTTSKSSIVDMSEAYGNIVRGENVYDKNGKLVLNGELLNEMDTQSSIGENGKAINSKTDTIEDVLRSEEEFNEDLDISVGLQKLNTRVSKYNSVKSPSQLLFESSKYSTSAQKRVIDSIDDYTLIDINDMNVNQLRLFNDIIYKNLSTDADKKAENKYFKQRLGEQGGDLGTNSEVYREFIFNKVKHGLFFIPKTINLEKDNYKEMILPVSATGFEVVENSDGTAKIHHIATGLKFNVDYSDGDSLYLNGYLGLIDNNTSLKQNVNTYVSSGWKLSDSQVPSPYRFVSEIDNKVSDFTKFGSSIDLLKENIKSSKTTQSEEVAAEISEYLARNSELLKNYEESRNKYIRSQEKLLDELNKSKSIFRSGAVLESMNRVSDSLMGNAVNGVDVSKFSKVFSDKKLEAFLNQKDELKDITEEEYNLHKDHLRDIRDECQKNYQEFVDNCGNLLENSGRINNYIVSVEDELVSKFLPSLDEKQALGTKIMDDLNKLELVNNNLVENADMLLSLNFDSMGIKRFVDDPKVSKELEGEVMEIFNGDKSVNDYRKLIDNNTVSTKYYIEEPKESSDMDFDDDENGGKMTGKSDGELKDTRYSTDFKGKVKLVFDEALTIIEDHVRDLYLSTKDRKERMLELLKLESFFIRELSRHRKSLSIVINRVVLPEDEIIDENETNELKMRILLKIHEEKTKLMYIREVLDKLFFFPHFRGVRAKTSLRLIEMEEEGIRSKFGFTYIPKFKYGEDDRPIGIYGFKKMDYYDLRLEFFNRLISGFEYDSVSYGFDLEILSLLEELNHPELSKLLYSDSYIESSIFSKRIKLTKILKTLIKNEENKDLRNSLKRIYFMIKRRLDDTIKFEMEHFGSSALESVVSTYTSLDDNGECSKKPIILSSDGKSSKSKSKSKSSNKQRRRMRRNN
ncbi:uncharacterized protein cubi_00060 [Cryptosporidium ubiquitum]|uniref:Uncharacterized protein n=1 Tax=Cryptosporidium ubiquitum TaxID=857276 RepID=A0A1J4MM22_9CRYT|nr:uncharacterized protein cubi_00060 [Cryptosporidium ubiquitum]OII74507.1 hypothetical protein cubi_00060 [Cryptosporidium ubiquitum]